MLKKLNNEERAILKILNNYLNLTLSDLRDLLSTLLVSIYTTFALLANYFNKSNIFKLIIY